MNSKKKRRGQMSEAFCTAMFLSLSGGLQDVYTYLFRGKVFANAQTGNIVLMAVHAFAGEWGHVLHYLVPLCFFALGVFAAELMHQKLQNLQRLHWRQLVVLCEIVMLFVVGFFPQEWNLMANALVSFACAMQVQTFRKVNGYAFASTMCIGNMRSGMDSLCSWVLNRNPAALKKSLYYWGIILLFALGAGLGSLTLDLCGAKAIWFSCLLLAVSFCLMFLKEDVEEIKEDLEALEANQGVSLSFTLFTAMPKAPLVGELASASETEGFIFLRIYPTLPRSPSSYRQNDAMKGGSPMWELLYETFWDRLEHFCFNLCRDEARAEDLTQEVFLRALQNRSLINSFTERQCKAWLFTTARNLYCDQLRRTAKEEQLLSTFFPEEDRAEPDSALDTVEAASLLALLTPEERRLFTLRYTAGYNASEIGQLLCLPPGTVRSRLAQIRHRLKTELTED